MELTDQADNAMVGVELPTMPEVSSSVTTLSINHEATMDLDSTNAFEGIDDCFV
jgi:hypothetical protein